MRVRLVVSVLLLSVAVLVAACGGDAADDLPLGDRLTRQATSPPSAPLPSPPAPTAPAQPAPTQPASTPDPAAALQVRTLGNFVLTEADLPAGYTLRNNQPAFKQEIVDGQLAIPRLASFLRDASLLGAWVALLTHPGPPESGVSSIIYLFAAPADARALVDLAAQIGAEDYLSATEAQALPPPAVGDAAALMRYATLSGRSLELSWAQGPMVGQVIFRYASGAEPPGAVQQITALGQAQAARMAAFLP